MLSLIDNYRYQYVKLAEQQVSFSTDVLIEVYLRYNSADVKKALIFDSISESVSDQKNNYIVGYIPLKNLIDNKVLIEKDKSSIISTGNRKFYDKSHTKNGTAIHANALIKNL